MGKVKKKENLGVNLEQVFRVQMWYLNLAWTPRTMKKIQLVALKVKDLAMNSRWNEIRLTSKLNSMK